MPSLWSPRSKAHGGDDRDTRSVGNTRRRRKGRRGDDDESVKSVGSVRSHLSLGDLKAKFRRGHKHDHDGDRSTTSVGSARRHLSLGSVKAKFRRRHKHDHDQYHVLDDDASSLETVRQGQLCDIAEVADFIDVDVAAAMSASVPAKEGGEEVLTSLEKTKGLDSVAGLPQIIFAEDVAVLATSTEATTMTLRVRVDYFLLNRAGGVRRDLAHRWYRFDPRLTVFPFVFLAYQFSNWQFLRTIPLLVIIRIVQYLSAWFEAFASSSYGRHFQSFWNSLYKFYITSIQPYPDMPNPDQIPGYGRMSLSLFVAAKKIVTNIYRDIMTMSQDRQRTANELLVERYRRRKSLDKFTTKMCADCYSDGPYVMDLWKPNR